MIFFYLFLIFNFKTYSNNNIETLPKHCQESANPNENGLCKALIDEKELISKYPHLFRRLSEKVIRIKLPNKTSKKFENTADIFYSLDSYNETNKVIVIENHCHETGAYDLFHLKTWSTARLVAPPVWSSDLPLFAELNADGTGYTKSVAAIWSWDKKLFRKIWSSEKKHWGISAEWKEKGKVTLKVVKSYDEALEIIATPVEFDCTCTIVKCNCEEPDQLPNPTRKDLGML